MALPPGSPWTTKVEGVDWEREPEFLGRLTTLDGSLEDLIDPQAVILSEPIAEKLNIHQNTALKRIRQLADKGLIYKQGHGPRVRYSI